MHICILPCILFVGSEHWMWPDPLLVCAGSQKAKMEADYLKLFLKRDVAEGSFIHDTEVAQSCHDNR